MSTRAARGDSGRRLMEAARAMIGESGFTGLRVREVAKRARVNLGLFHYHFKTKDEFIRRLLEEIYEDFFRKLNLESHTGRNNRDRLRRSLLIFGRFARDNRALFMALLVDVIRGDKNCLAFLKANMPRHIEVIAGIIKEAQSAGEFKPTALPLAVGFAVGGMGAPNIVITAMERFGGHFPLKGESAEIKELFLSDEAMEQRADLILAALAAEPKRRRP